MDYRAVLTAALHTEVYSDHWGTRCDVFDIPGMDKRAYLRPSSDATLAFLVVPADTLTLARVFFRRTKGVAGVRRLARDPEWRVEHSFHFGFMSTGYAWTTGDIDIDRYLDVWVEAIETAGAVARADWDRYFAWLVEQEIATPKDLTIQSVAERYSGIAGARDRLVAICCAQHIGDASVVRTACIGAVASSRLRSPLAARGAAQGRKQVPHAEAVSALLVATARPDRAVATGTRATPIAPSVDVRMTMLAASSTTVVGRGLNRSTSGETRRQDRDRARLIEASGTER